MGSNMKKEVMMGKGRNIACRSPLASRIGRRGDAARQGYQYTFHRCRPSAVGEEAGDLPWQSAPEGIGYSYNVHLGPSNPRQGITRGAGFPTRCRYRKLSTYLVVTEYGPLESSDLLSAAWKRNLYLAGPLVPYPTRLGPVYPEN